MSRHTEIERRRYIGEGGFPLNTFSTGVYADGAVGTPNPPIPTGQNPYFQWDAEQGKFVPIPGSPADKS